MDVRAFHVVVSRGGEHPNSNDSSDDAHCVRCRLSLGCAGYAVSSCNQEMQKKIAAVHRRVFRLIRAVRACCSDKTLSKDSALEILRRGEAEWKPQPTTGTNN